MTYGDMRRAIVNLPVTVASGLNVTKDVLLDYRQTLNDVPLSH